MPLIITPVNSERRAELYHQLGVMISAGLTIRQSLEQLRNNPPDRSLRPKISEWLNSLEQGLTVAQSVQNMGQWMPSFDLALIEAEASKADAWTPVSNCWRFTIQEPRPAMYGEASDFGPSVSCVHSARGRVRVSFHRLV